MVIPLAFTPRENGSRTFTFMADPDDLITELDENDNRLTESVFVRSSGATT